MPNYANFAPQQGQRYYQGQGDFRGGYNNREYRQSGAQQSAGIVGKKRSGCKRKESYYSHRDKKQVDRPCIFGWRAGNRKAGRPFMKFVAVPAKKVETKNENFLKFVATIQPEGAAPYLATAFLNLRTGRLHFPDLDLIANPAKDYWGVAYKRKNSN